MTAILTVTLTDVARPSPRRQFAALRALFRKMASLPQETQAQFARVRAAYVLQAEFSNLPDEALGDAGMSAEDILSARSYSEGLPFFMQSGFGRRR
ncbi:MAG: hypothetical protein ACOY4T_14605 [Pseudomonadota bacterium]